MRKRTLALLGALFGLFGCAHTREDVHAAATTSGPPLIERDVVTIEAAPLGESVVARPRLSQTIILGQGTAAQYTPSGPPPSGQSQNVVVNNNIVVEAPPRYGYGGYGGYYGYGGYTGYGGYGRPVFNDGRGTRGAAPAQWGSTGWEGARRTAAPGQTPGIGGNYSPAPSYGPAPMR